MKQTRPINIQDRWTPLERRLASRMRHAPIGQCLTFEQFMGLAQQGRRAKEYHAHMLHVVSCPGCRRAYLELRALLRLQRPSLARWLRRFSLPNLPQWALASGVAASVFTLALWTFYPRSNNPALVAKRPDTPPRVEVAQNSQNSPVVTNEGSQSKTPSDDNRAETFKNPPNRTTLSGKRDAKQWAFVDNGGTEGKRNNASSPLMNGKPSGTRLVQKPPSKPEERVPPKEPSDSAEPVSSTPSLEQRLADASSLFKTPIAELSKAFASLTMNSTRRGGGSETSTGQVKFIEPDLSESKLLEDDRPLFKWKPVGKAVKYAITLKLESGDATIEDELPPERTEYRPSTPLERGKKYTLTIVVVREGQTMKGKLEFQVMSVDDLHDLRVARENMRQHPEASGVVLYRLQRYREALEAFELAQQRYPDDEKLNEAVKSLRRLVK